jgi:hypothetical protein
MTNALARGLELTYTLEQLPCSGIMRIVRADKHFAPTEEAVEDTEDIFAVREWAYEGNGQAFH